MHVLVAGFVGFKGSKGGGTQHVTGEEFLAYVMGTGQARVDEPVLKLMQGGKSG